MKRNTTIFLAAALALLALAPAARAGHSVDLFLGESLSSGDGQFQVPTGLAVDQTSGQIYLPEVGGNRIQRFDAEGNFELMWGSGVASGVAQPEVCTAAEAPCRQGMPGGLGGMFDSPRAVAIDEAAGQLYVLDSGNGRVQQFSLDDNGTPGDPSDDLPVFVRAWGWDVIQSGAPGNVFSNDKTEVGATGATFFIQYMLGITESNGSSNFSSVIVSDIPANATAGTVQSFLEASSGLDPGDVTVTGPAGGPWTITFVGRFADTDVAVFAPISTPLVHGAGYEVCEVASDCKGASIAEEPKVGQIMKAENLALNPLDSTLVVAESTGIQRFSSDGSSPAQLVGGALSPRWIALDSQGVLYGSSSESKILRYDTTGAVRAGGTPGFLDPIPSPPLLAGTGSEATIGMAMDLDSDGAGPEVDRLFVLRNPDAAGAETVIQQIDSPAEVANPGVDNAWPSGRVADDGRHGEGVFGEHSAKGLAYNATADAFYVFSEAGQAGPGIWVLDADGTPTNLEMTANPPSGVTSSEAQLSGTIDPQGIAEYGFQYSTAASGPWQNVPGGGHVRGFEPKPVAATASGLQPNTTYHVRLVATKWLSLDEKVSVTSPATEFTTDPAPPEFRTLPAHSFTDTSAWLVGELDPQGSPTSFRFEWGADTAYGNQLPDPDGDAGSGNDPEGVLRELSGLQPNTTYHYRFCAENSVGGGCGQDRTFTTRSRFEGFASRAYEQASPAEKLGVDLGEFGVGNAVAPDGNAAVLSSRHTFADADFVASPLGGEIKYQARRDMGGDGWTTKVASPPPLGFDEGSGGASGVDLPFYGGPSDSLVAFNAGLADPELGRGAFVRDWQTGALAKLYNQVARGFGTVNEVAGASAAMDSVVFETTEVLTADPGIPFDGRKIYEWVPELAASLNERQKVHVSDERGGLTGGTFTLTFEGQTTAPIPFNATPAALKSALEALPKVKKGDVAVFSSAPPSPNAWGIAWGVEFTGSRAATDVPQMSVDGSGLVGDGAPQAVVRTDGPLRLVSVDVAGVPLAESMVASGTPKILRGAVSDDGRHVFFMSPFNGSAAKIYRRSDGQTTTLVSPSQVSPVDPKGEKAKEYVWATPDGERVFFLSSEQLTDDANTGPEREGKDLYRYDVPSATLVDLSATVGGDGAQVAGLLGASDGGDWVYYVAKGQVVPGQGIAERNNVYLWHDDGSADGETRFVATLAPGTQDDSVLGPLGPAGEAGSTARVTPDGQSLLIQSVASLTGFPNQGYPQLYLYEADANGGAGALSCVSCAADGSPAAGGAAIPRSGVRSESGDALTRVLSDDGSRVAFHSKDDLLAADTNGRQDVYLWEEGRLQLVSTGKSTSHSALQGIGRSGDDVFLMTYERLVGQDDDDLLDLYDYRVGGGIPEQSPPPPGEPCASEGCKPQPEPTPPATTPPSVGLQGPGNVKSPPKRCAKGKVRRKGRCVRRRKASRNRAATKRKRAGARRRAGK